MKKYIFMTSNIYLVGGIQNYLASKIRYLKKNGWETYAFFCSGDSGECAYSILNEYRKMEVKELVLYPGAWTLNIVEETIQKMMSMLLETSSQEEIVIESHTDILALWGELLAKRLDAKHMCFICNELFEGPNKFYKQYLDFFYFKYIRRELYGIQEESINQLFEGGKYQVDDRRFVFFAAVDECVQDIDNIIVEGIQRKDVNICFLGREDKLWDEIVKGVVAFSKNNALKSINFILVGKIWQKRKYIESELKSVKNVTLICTNDLVPIPKKLFEKCDVVIATSGCACLAAEEGVPVIVADAIRHLAIGVLGYTTQRSVSTSENLYKYEDLLEEILFRGLCNSIECCLPKKITEAEKHYNQHFSYIERSDKEKRYYNNIMTGKRNYYKCMGYYIRKYFPGIMRVKQKLKRSN